MCWLLKLSKYISIPIIVGWLQEDGILRLEAAISNQQLRKSFRELLSEYARLLSENIFSSRNNMSLIHACAICNRWSLKPSNVQCKIRIDSFDLLSIRRLKLSSVVTSIVPLISNTDLKVIGDEEEYLIKMMSLAKGVQTLDIISSTSDVFSSIFVHKLLTTVKLDVYDPEMKTAAKAMFRLCPSLENVEIKNLNDWTVVLTLLVHCRNLKELSAKPSAKMMQMSTIVPAVFSFHMSGRLESFDSSNPLYVFAFKVGHFFWYKGSRLARLQLNADSIKTVPVSLGAMCPNLESISFVNNSNFASNVEYHNAVGSTIRNCPSIKSIHLLKITNPTDETLLSLAAVCNAHLREFYLDGRTPFPFSLTGVQTLCTQCTQLTTLALINLILSDEMIVSIVSLCVHLTKLHLLDVSDVTSNCLQLVAPHCKKLMQFSFQSDVEITAEGLTAVADHCIHLTDLSLILCDFMTITACAALFNASSLKSIEISELTVYPPDVGSPVLPVTPLGASITKLTMNKTRLTSGSLLWVVQQCPRLEHLEVSANSNLTAAAMVEALPYLRRLRFLYLGSCDQIDDTVADAICKHCKRLELLNLLFTAVSNNAIEKIERICTTLLVFMHDGSV